MGEVLQFPGLGSNELIERDREIVAEMRRVEALSRDLAGTMPEFDPAATISACQNSTVLLLRYPADSAEGRVVRRQVSAAFTEMRATLSGLVRARAV